MSLEVESIGSGYLGDTYGRNCEELATPLVRAVSQLVNNMNIGSTTPKARGYHKDCPSNFQWPVCPNNHLAIYEVFNRNGEHFRYLCQRNGCDYRDHNYINHYLQPGHYVRKIEK